MSAEDNKRALLVAARQLTETGQTAGWAVLTKALRAKAQRMEKDLMRRLLVEGQDLAIMQRQIDQDRGYVAALKYVLAVVANADSKLKELEAELTSEEPDEEEDHWSGYRPPE